MHIAVSKAITEEQEFSLPTRHSCLPSASGCYFSLTGARCPDQTRRGSREKQKEEGEADNKERRDGKLFFAKCQEVNVLRRSISLFDVRTKGICSASCQPLHTGRLCTSASG